MKATAVGNYPKIPSNPEDPNFRDALNALERGEVPPRELEAVLQATIARVVREQEEAGLDLLTDGQLRWPDPVTPLARDFAGLDTGGLVRFYDNNVYYRRPVIKGRLWFLGSSLAEQWRDAARLTDRPVKAVLPGPYTAANLMLDRSYGDGDRLLEDLADNLALEARALIQAGARFVQFDEPSLAFAPEDAGQARAALQRVMEGLAPTLAELDEEVTTAVYVYFQDCTQLLDDLAEFPVDVIGLDLVTGGGGGYAVEAGRWSPAVERLAAEGYPKAVALGCLNGREVLLETLDDLLELFERVSQKIDPDSLYVNPNCGLDFLPHDWARRKLLRLGEAVEAFRTAGA